MADRFRAQGAKATAEDWLLVWEAESGISNIQTRIRDQNGNPLPFGGFNQMGPQERASCGFTSTLESWLSMTMAEQMPFIECYYRNAARAGGGAHVFRDAASLYVANFAPGLIAHAGDPDFALYKAPSQAYELNKGLDHGRKGFISVGDMGIAVHAVDRHPRFIEARDRVRALGAAPAGEDNRAPSPPLPAVSTTSTLTNALLAASVVGAIYFGAREIKKTRFGKRTLPA